MNAVDQPGPSEQLVVTTPLNGSYRICWTIDEWVTALREADESQAVGLDFETCPDPRREETTSPLRAEDGSRICGIALAWYGQDGLVRSAYVGIRHDRRCCGGRQPNARMVCQALSDFIKDRPDHKIVVVANMAMELSFMTADHICWPARGQIHDIQIAARVLNKGVGFKELIGLKELQADVLKRDMGSKNELDRWLMSRRFKPGQDIWRAPIAIAGWYAQDDSRDTLEIWTRWAPLVYQAPTSWWWSRAPNKTMRHDLYELEIEAGINAITSCIRGTRIDLALARRRANSAKILQDVATRWVRWHMQMPVLNPGSATQLRGLFFGELFGFKVSLAHMTDSFAKLTENDQSSVVAGAGPGKLIDYASLDVEALDYYAEQKPEHSDLMFMLAVYRKCSTAIQWFDQRVLEFGITPCPDPWWGDEYSLLHLVFHRLRTVGTLSGRMSSSDYNGQQVPKRFKMLLDAVRLEKLLREFLPENQLEQMMAMLDFAEAKKGDEAKSLRVEPGHQVIDFSVRRMLIARPGYNMRSHDLSQVEMCGFAHFSGNPLLCAGYGAAPPNDQTLRRLEMVQEGMYDWKRPPPDELNRHFEVLEFDIHAFIAKELNISRKAAKGINFGIVYGMGKKKLARSLGWTIEEGRMYLQGYNAKFPEIEQIQARIKMVLRERGYVFDPFGRRYYLPMSKSYVGLNRLIQGWAASVFKTGFVRTCEVFSSPRFGSATPDPITQRPSFDGARVLTCIHDEMMSEVHRDLDDYFLDWSIRSAMTLFFDLKVPLRTSSERSERSWDESVELRPPMQPITISNTLNN